MKVLAITLAIFVALLGFGTFAYYYIDHTADNLYSSTQSIEKNVQAKHWTEAQKQFSTFQANWDKTSKKWSVLEDHSELDNINTTMAKAKKFMEAKDYPGATSEIAQLKLLIKHIPEKEAVNLKNIL